MGVDGEVEQEAASFCRYRQASMIRAPCPSSTWTWTLTLTSTSTSRLRCIRRPLQPRNKNTPLAMSALPRSIGSRLLAPALRPSSVARAVAPTCRLYSTNEPEPHHHKVSSADEPAVPLKSDSTQIREESAAEGMRHQPDYNVAIDYRTSCVLDIVPCFV
jgi:hypothetical protein